jgi:hypothetical protein
MDQPADIIDVILFHIDSRKDPLKTTWTVNVSMMLCFPGTYLL